VYRVRCLARAVLNTDKLLRNAGTHIPIHTDPYGQDLNLHYANSLYGGMITLKMVKASSSDTMVPITSNLPIVKWFT